MLDTEKKRRGNADRQKRYKLRQKALLSQGVTEKALPEKVTPEIVLHPSIVSGIHRLTTNPDGTINEQDRRLRIGRAIHYEKMFPGRPYTGV